MGSACWLDNQKHLKCFSYSVISHNFIYHIFVTDSAILGSIFALLLRRRLLRKYRSNHAAKQRVLLVMGKISSPMTGFLLKRKIHEFTETQVRILSPRVRLGHGLGVTTCGCFSGLGCGCTEEPFVVLRAEGVHWPDGFRAHFLTGKVLPPGGCVSPKQTGLGPPNLEPSAEPEHWGAEMTMNSHVVASHTSA